MERPALLAGFLLGGVLLVARPRALAGLVARCEALVARDRPVERGFHDLRGVQPVSVDVEGLVVRAGTRPAWVALGALDVRSSTGANVVAVLRGPARAPEPLTPRTVVRPGDELVLAGTPSQLVAARRYLLQAT
ncbi:MAG TPA: TrkA C-terminal domain-containing protein [Candidatus Thermoplasmatota archaeon]|nr:TrkA C-terminal domain-containing protein [Candidatus Thermoplasmatota archaeon]